MTVRQISVFPVIDYIMTDSNRLHGVERIEKILISGERKNKLLK